MTHLVLSLTSMQRMSHLQEHLRRRHTALHHEQEVQILAQTDEGDDAAAVVPNAVSAATVQIVNAPVPAPAPATATVNNLLQAKPVVRVSEPVRCLLALCIMVSIFSNQSLLSHNMCYILSIINIFCCYYCSFL
jgi:hypothetical protein